MRATYTLDSLKSKTTEELEVMFNDKTKPTLEMVLHKLKRKPTKKGKK